MAASIILTGLAANDPVPGNYLQINFAQGVSSGSGSPNEVILVGNASTAGVAVRDTTVYGPDTQVPLQTEPDCISLFGAGSELHIGWRAFTKVNQVTTLRAIAVTSSAGTAASATITLTNASTGTAALRFFYGGTFYDTSIGAADSVTLIATNVCLTLNAVTFLPFTAGSSAGVITLTAKIPGPRGNQIRFQTAILAGTTATTTSVTVDTAFTSGATSDSNVAALATILANKSYRIVSAANDATQLGALITQVNLQALPLTGIRQRVFAASIDTIANSITLATGVNAARGEIQWQKSSPHLPFELAANWAAIVSSNEDTGDNFRCNFAGYGNGDNDTWVIKASRDQTAFPTRTDIKSALNNGLSPIGVNSNGTTYVVNRITTRSLSGSTSDYRIRDSHKVTVCDFFANSLLARVNSQFSAKKIADNPPPGGDAPGADVVTPDIYRGAVFTTINQYAANTLLQGVPAIKAGVVVQRETNPSTRMSCRIPLNTVDIFLQSANEVDQVG